MTSREWSKKELAELLKTARGSRTQAELARQAGVSDRTIVAIETRKLERAPRAVTVARLALATNADVKKWLGCINARLPETDLDRLRLDLTQQKLLDKLEPASEIKHELRDEITRIVGEIRQRMNGALEEFQPAQKLKNELRGELMAEVNQRLDFLRSAIADLQVRFNGLRDEFESHIRKGAGR